MIASALGLAPLSCFDFKLLLELGQLRQSEVGQMKTRFARFALGQQKFCVFTFRKYSGQLMTAWERFCPACLDTVKHRVQNTVFI